MIHIASKKDIEGMRAAGKLAAQILNEVEKIIRPGISTLQINELVDQLTTEAGAISAPYGYTTDPDTPPFPKHCCTSKNEVVAHGIPSDKVWLGKRDIINVDITVILNGYHGDTSRTFFSKKPKPEVKKLVEVTQQAMMAGIEAIKPGGCISDIGKAIEEFVQPHKYGIVDQLTGHGIGQSFHQEPAIFHCYRPELKQEIKPGMIWTVEPMLNLGKKDVRLMPDYWTIVTADGKWSAQFEHTILVTETGYEILTLDD